MIQLEDEKDITQPAQTKKKKKPHTGGREIKKSQKNVCCMWTN